MRQLVLFIMVAFVMSAATAFAGPFSDVPAGHWAYKAIEKAVEAGILQGYDGKFHGNKTLNRYQMAVVVARMLDRIETMGPGKVSKKDIENLEALTIEFADELALLNVKVSTLEDGFADLKKDVDVLKKDYASGGAKAGISGLLQTRLVLTDEDHDNFTGRGFNAADGAVSAFPFAANDIYAGSGTAAARVMDAAADDALNPAIPPATPVVDGQTGTSYTAAGLPFAVYNRSQAVAAGSAVPAGYAAGSANAGSNVAGTLPLTRYMGVGGNAAVAPNTRTFFNIAQASVGFDRHFDEDFYLHLQLDIDADNEQALASGQSIQVNEAYVDMEKFIADGDARLRVGSYALPMARERNPEMVEYPNQLRYGFRSLDLTVTPAYYDQVWESIRNTGVSLWNGKDSKFQWQLGVGSTPNIGLDGSLFAAKMAAGFFGDRLFSLTAAGPQNQDYFGFYAWAGDKYDSGWRWDAGYFQNGGDLNPTNAVATAVDYSAFQINVGYWGWENWGFMGSYYDATSNTFTPAAAAGSLILPGGAGRNFVNLGLYPVLAAGQTFPDVDSKSFALLANYKFNDDNNVTVRYEDAEDTMGASAITARIWTFDWNHRISNNSLLQLEYVTPESDSTTVAPGFTAAGVFNGTAGVATQNSNDVNDDLFLLNYKVKF